MARSMRWFFFLVLLWAALLAAMPAVGGTPAAAASSDPLALLPEDTTPQFTVSRIEIRGNTLLATQTLLRAVPAVYNASTDGAVVPAALYDLRPVQAVIREPGAAQPISARTIQGFLQYLQSLYGQRGYAGIFVHVPADAYAPDSALEAGTLPIEIMETTVSDVSASYYDVNNQAADRGYLDPNVLTAWSPIQRDRTVNRHQLDNFISLLNLNPDRYVSALVSEGDDPNRLAVTYNVYEADPWHYFVQVDNSGTEDIEWKPRIGLVNTNLFGFDDRLTAIYQVSPDSQWDEEYSVYGNYDFPLAGPGLRLSLFAGYSEFDAVESDGLSFLGRGSFYGGTLRYNLFQADRWFVDLTGTLSYEENRTTPSLMPEFLATDLHWVLAGFGVEAYRTEDRWDALFGFTRYCSIDGSPQEEFDMTRTLSGAERDFSFMNLYGRHSRYLDADKVQRLSGLFQWIDSEDRLPPGRMTAFGGMYTVRGYEEYEVIADEGLLASVQYEYDLVRREQAALFEERTGDREAARPFLRKLAPLLFADYGLAKVEDAVPGEDEDVELFSVGGGLLVELGDHFTGTVYYGYPLIETEETGEGSGRVHAGILVRW